MELCKEQLKDREEWIVLTKLANDNKLIEFYKEYAKYLERSGLESNYRKTIHKMAKMVVEELEVNESVNNGISDMVLAMMNRH